MPMPRATGPATISTIVATAGAGCQGLSGADHGRQPGLGRLVEILGRSEVDGTSLQTFRRWAEAGTADRFGWQVVGFAPEYQLRDNLILEAAAGGMWTAGMPTACPAVLRTATGACGGPNNSLGQPIYNFTGGSNFLGWEVDVGFRYSIMPGLTWTPRFGYADYGGANSANNRTAQGAWTFSNRMIYIF